MIVTTEPRSGWRRASLSAAATLQPLEMPQKRPSSRASRRAMSTLSSVVVVITPVSSETSRLRGTKPSPMPSMPWWPHARRERQSRAMLTTLLLSFGVPLLLGGDERGRTQQGNNNAYCQDNEITWFDWSTADEELLAFTRRLIAFRQRHPVFRRRRFLAGKEA